MDWSNLIFVIAPFLAGFSVLALTLTLLLIVMGKIKV